MRTSNYYIAIIPPQPVVNSIVGFQEAMRDRFESEHALRNMPHITLVPPFSMADEKSGNLQRLLEDVLKEFKPMQLQMDGFGCFGRHTIYVNVEAHPDLTLIRNTMFDALNHEKDLLSRPMRYFQKFVPHITIGYRDLKDHFKEAWAYFGSKSYQEAFEMNQVSLMRHDGERWEVLMVIDVAS